MENQLLLWSVRIAMLLYVASLARWIWAAHNPVENASLARSQRYIWTLGCLAFLVHVAAAFHFRHGWSHQQALLHTAEETERLVGWSFGGGIYFSYAFTVSWCLDVAWMWFNQESHRKRARWITMALHVFLLAISINGAIVFATGPIRWMGIVLLGLLGACYWLTPRQPGGH